MKTELQDERLNVQDKSNAEHSTNADQFLCQDENSSEFYFNPSLWLEHNHDCSKIRQTDNNPINDEFYTANKSDYDEFVGSFGKFYEKRISSEPS